MRVPQGKSCLGTGYRLSEHVFHGTIALSAATNAMLVQDCNLTDVKKGFRMNLKSRFVVFMGALSGAVIFSATGVALGLLIGRFLFSGSMSMLELVLGVLGSILGVMVGNGLGATIMAKRQGSRRKAWFFWLIGVGSVIIIMLLAEPLRLNQNTELMMVGILLFPPLVEAIFA